MSQIEITGAEVLLDLLAGHGVDRVFGNPGTTELPLHDALARDDRFQYVLGLQEIPVMAMADGWAMAQGRLGFVNVHISCGLGNSLGMLYAAHREGTPLLVTAGQQDRRLRLADPILSGDLVGVTKPWTKWSHEVTRLGDLPTAIRRAVQTALTPPTGPVFLSLPIDLQMESTRLENLDLSPIDVPDSRVRPPSAAVRRAADVLLEGRAPVILAGSRVVERRASTQLTRVAELLGAPVYCESSTSHGRLPMDSSHPLYRQSLPLWSPQVRETLAPFDVVLVTGMDLLREYVYHEPAKAIPESMRIVHIDEDPAQLGRNFALAAAVTGHTPECLEELAELLQRDRTEAQAEVAQARLESEGRGRQQQQQAMRERVDQGNPLPMTELQLMASVADTINNRDVAVVEEAVTTTNHVLERLGVLREPEAYFGHRGWTLGWGLGCAIGVQMAWPERATLALLGEGAAMYGIQGLWTAAHCQTPVTFVICNNAQYRILKIGARGLQLPEAQAGNYAGMDLVNPEIDFVGLAESLGVRAARTETVDAFRSELADALEDPHPRLIDAPHQRTMPSDLV